METIEKIDILQHKEKIAETNYPILDVIKNRWSTRSFKEMNISDETLTNLFEAASWAASSRNEQPCEYIYAHRGTEGFEKLANCLMEGNRWAKDAPVLILSMARKTFSKNDKPNTHYFHDTGAANTTMLLQAVNMGILGHMMAGFDKEKTINNLDIDDSYEPVCFIALGYPDEAEKLEDPFKEREYGSRSRKPVKEFVSKI
ncbi:nitroreductase family protein [Mangrovivirga sp. M17]|uniref:Nitroreductase family protein n=1 Tax=Mangrovivirga halotolerans TaxID=2993936 RepID=A0ABT3RWA2_9BACT|nr:nitroreductase family protein [Mangrovivirga halotolerans]MCX2746060.1 nitroreductase family protein [Mangrovivirga halotolerans]